MRVLYLHQHFTTPEKGGGTRSYELAKRLIARGHSVCIVCGEFAKLDLTPTDKKAISRGVIDGINVIQISLHYSNTDGISKRVRTYLRFRSDPTLHEQLLGELRWLRSEAIILDSLLVPSPSMSRDNALARRP